MWPGGDFVVNEAHLPPGGRLLDIATGTGDIALEALRRDGELKAVSADFSLAMMQRGRSKPGAQLLRWLGADALALPCPMGRSMRSRLGSCCVT